MELQKAANGELGDASWEFNDGAQLDLSHWSQLQLKPEVEQLQLKPEEGSKRTNFGPLQLGTVGLFLTEKEANFKAAF